MHNYLQLSMSRLVLGRLGMSLTRLHREFQYTIGSPEYCTERTGSACSPRNNTADAHHLLNGAKFMHFLVITLTSHRAHARGVLIEILYSYQCFPQPQRPTFTLLVSQAHYSGALSVTRVDRRIDFQNCDRFNKKP